MAAAPGKKLSMLKCRGRRCCTITETTEKTREKCSDDSLINTKKSFEPVSDSNTSILILGSLSGDKSIEMGEYYGHPRNRFWVIIASITKSPLLATYADKKQLLLKNRVGVWDVAHTAQRIGSPDTAIKKEVPNDIEGFIKGHKHLKIIAFNGSKSEKLYDKYFQKRKGIKYLSLPSSSPANARYSLESLCEIWKQMVEIE